MIRGQTVTVVAAIYLIIHDEFYLKYPTRQSIPFNLWTYDRMAGQPQTNGGPAPGLQNNLQEHLHQQKVMAKKHRITDARYPTITGFRRYQNLCHR